MVRLIGLLLILAMLYLYTLKLNQPKPADTYNPPSIITVEELPPIRAENE